MFRALEEEEKKLNMSQKHWHCNRRSASAFSFLEKDDNHPESKNSQLILNVKGLKKTSSSDSLIQGDLLEKAIEVESVSEDLPILPLELNAAKIGDFPARYTVYSVEAHEFPVKGLYIDQRVLPGFKYRVRRLPDSNGFPRREKERLFRGKSLVLLNIGRGYARRFTFEDDQGSRNYFYSDNHPDGYAFELQVLSNGDKFTVHDVNHEPRGMLEIIKVDRKQIEIDFLRTSSRIERRIKVRVTAKVEFDDKSISHQIPLVGTAICVKNNNEKLAKVTKVLDITINQRRYYLTPGYQESCRRIHVNGRDIGDVPTRYTVFGLSAYEFPVIGTYVDPRILPGFNYKVRINKRSKYFFNGRALGLQSIGMGYAKRLTFQPDSRVHPENFLWSDNYVDGLALQIKVVMEGMNFLIMAGDQLLGEATVFRADLPQVEERMEQIKIKDNRTSYVKYVHIDVMCHVKMDINDSGVFHNANLVRVYGLAVARKDSDGRNAYLERVENVGLDSQLNLIFARSHREITFLPAH